MSSFPERELLECFLPVGVFTWFDATKGIKTDETMTIILTEKNTPPTEGLVLSKGFTDITITDFPIRGRKTSITFKRRRWTDAQGKVIKRDIPLTFPHTKLEAEFALFLKEES